MPNILDSGERRQFASGAVRDIVDGKGRMDLIPLDIALEILYTPTETVVSDDKEFLFVWCIEQLYKYCQNHKFDAVVKSVLCFRQLVGWSKEDCLLEVSCHYEDGAKKYGEHNWEKGIPTHSFLDSAVRHLTKYMRGDSDERHDRAFLWNIFGLVWTNKYHMELDDIESYLISEEDLV